MAYRGTDPFAPKTTRNERFAQMSKQEQLIEQKKREIQAKLVEQKKKEADEALKKFQSASGNSKSGLGNKTNSNSGQHRNARKSFWKSNHDQRWKKENQHVEDKGLSQSSNSVNVFSNDGSFLDQFRKLSGVKEPKNKKDDDIPGTSSNNDPKPSTSSAENVPKQESDTDWGTWGPSLEKQVPEPPSEAHPSDEIQSNNSGEKKNEKEEDLQNSDRLGTSHWFQSSQIRDERVSWQGQDDSPHRPSSPYSPTRATTDAPSKSPEKNVLPSPTPFHTVALHPPPSIPVAPPPPLITQQPVQPFLPYAAPPPPLLTLPPPAPIQTNSVPPPSSATLNLPHPASLIQHTIPASLPNNASNLAPQLLHPPPLIQQHTIPTPPLLASAINPLSSIAVPPPVMLGHHIPPPGIALPVSATTGLSTPTGTGVSPAAPVLDPLGEDATTHLARMVAQCGDDIEEIITMRNPDDQALWFLHDKKSTAYIQYRCLVEKFRTEVKKDEKEENEEFVPVKVKEEIDDGVRSDENSKERMGPSKAINEYGTISKEFRIKKEMKQEQEDENSRQSEGKRSGEDSDEGATRRRKRRSRWAPECVKVEVAATGVGTGIPPPLEQVTVLPVPGGPQLLSKVVRTDQALVQYAIQAFGTSNLSEEDWKKAEDHYKINLLYQDMMRKRQELERLQRAGKFKYEYDSDEETDGGTWEHRLRLQEMEATELWAEELTKKAEGKHHIGDFLPPDELERFLEKYSALQEGREPDLSDYKEFKLKEDNIGFQMLQKLGWTEGQGLGSDGLGITDPVNKASSRPDNQGLGLERPEEVSRGDDEYDAYRKRMMLAYRFRPNPLNNPRRPYY